MLKRTITGVILATFIIICIWVQGYVVVGLLTLASLICMHEMLSCLKRGGKRPVQWVSYLFMLAMGAAQALVLYQGGGMLKSLAVMQAVLGLGVIVGFSAVVAKGRVDMDAVFDTVMPLVYPGMFCAMIFPLNCIGGKMYTLVAMALCFFVASMNDLFAMLVGVRFGKHKLSPQLSPKKTVEGSVAGIVAAVVFSVVIPYLFSGVMRLIPYAASMVQPLPAWWQFALLGIPMGVAAQFGDLAASLIKRQCGVKDFGGIFPGHGGILDRLDGVFFSTVVVLCFFMIVGV